MNRKIGVIRTYFLGNFKNVKVEDELDDIPEHLALDKDFMNAVYYLMLVSVELAYRKYQQLNMELPTTLEDSLAVLEDIKGSTMESIKQLIQNGKEKPKKEE